MIFRCLRVTALLALGGCSGRSDDSGMDVDGGDALDNPCSEVSLWDWTEVPTPDSPSRVELTVDPDGRPAIAFVTTQEFEETLHFATRNSDDSDWVVEDVTSLESGRTYATGEITRPVFRGDEAHLLFLDSVSASCVHAFKSNNEWQISAFPALYFGPTSLTTLENGDLMASFSDGAGLHTSYFDGSGWSEAETVESSAVPGGTRGTGGFPTPYEAGGQQRILFFNANEELRRATKSGVEWGVQAVATLGDTFAQGPMSVAIEGSVAHVLYAAPAEGRAPLAHFSDESGSWETEEVYPAPSREQAFSEVRWFTSLTALGSGDLHATIGSMTCEGGELLSRRNNTWS